MRHTNVVKHLGRGLLLLISIQTRCEPLDRHESVEIPAPVYIDILEVLQGDLRVQPSTLVIVACLLSAAVHFFRSVRGHGAWQARADHSATWRRLDLFVCCPRCTEYVRDITALQ